MKIPSKVISYKESSLSKYARTLQYLDKQDCTPIELFNGMTEVFSNVDEFIDVLDGLYALRAIEFDDESGVISYVKRSL